ncbi:MAG: non-canonical purine NTP pyrophosphatase [Thermodesulfovibrio sp.]|nr:non-canonical purine NTP pyrophosphatase [Thermodesulfovibrio sp.]
MDIVLATKNKKKAAEMSRMFKGQDFRFLTLESFPDCPDVEEDGKTFRANALKKGRAVASFTGHPALADDSGLEVLALGKAPGVYSARYAGPDADDRKNLKKLLREMRELEGEERDARFVCCMALVLPDGHHKTFTGYVSGRIGKKEKGNNGFGYDPVFYPEGHAGTFAEMDASEKDSMSHRGRALKKLFQYLSSVALL